MQVDETATADCAEYALGRDAAEAWIGKGLTLMRKPQVALERREQGFCDRLEEERGRMQRCMTPGGEAVAGWLCTELTEASATWRKGNASISVKAETVEKLWHASKEALASMREDA